MRELRLELGTQQKQPNTRTSLPGSAGHNMSVVCLYTQTVCRTARTSTASHNLTTINHSNTYQLACGRRGCRRESRSPDPDNDDPPATPSTALTNSRADVAGGTRKFQIVELVLVRGKVPTNNVFDLQRQKQASSTLYRCRGAI